MYAVASGALIILSRIVSMFANGNVSTFGEPWKFPFVFVTVTLPIIIEPPVPPGQFAPSKFGFSPITTFWLGFIVQFWNTFCASTCPPVAEFNQIFNWFIWKSAVSCPAVNVNTIYVPLFITWFVYTAAAAVQSSTSSGSSDLVE